MQQEYYTLRVRSKVYNPRENEDMKDTFEIKELRFETEQAVLDYIRTSNIKRINIVSLEHRIVNQIDIHEKLNNGTFIVGVDSKSFTFNSKTDALKFLQSQTSDRISLTCMPFKE